MAEKCTVIELPCLSDRTIIKKQKAICMIIEAWNRVTATTIANCLLSFGYLFFYFFF